MTDMELGILLNIILWIAVIPVVVTIGVWVCVLFFDAREKDQGNVRAAGGRDPSQASEGPREEDRKAA